MHRIREVFAMAGLSHCWPGSSTRCVHSTDPTSRRSREIGTTLWVHHTTSRGKRLARATVIDSTVLKLVGIVWVVGRHSWIIGWVNQTIYIRMICATWLTSRYTWILSNIVILLFLYNLIICHLVIWYWSVLVWICPRYIIFLTWLRTDSS